MGRVSDGLRDDGAWRRACRGLLVVAALPLRMALVATQLIVHTILALRLDRELGSTAALARCAEGAVPGWCRASALRIARAGAAARHRAHLSPWLFNAKRHPARPRSTRRAIAAQRARSGAMTPPPGEDTADDACGDGGTAPSCRYADACLRPG